jgi:hypothetical protein
MENSSPSKEFKDWCLELDTLCVERFLIDASDMGIDAEQLFSIWKSDLSPHEISEKFRLKYDLTTAKSVMLGG